MKLPRLREWREFRGLTQPELAERAGLSLRSVFNYEHGGNALPNSTRKLAEALGVEIGDLLDEEAHPKGAAPPSVQLTINGVLAEERRRPTAQELQALDRWLSYLESRLNRQDLSAAEIEHELDAVRAFGKLVPEYPDELFDRFMHVARRAFEEAKSLRSLRDELADLETDMTNLKEAHEQARQRR